MNKYKATFKTINSNIVYYRKGKIKSMNDMADFVLETGRRCGELNPTLKCKNYCYVTYTAKEYKEKDIELEYVEACNVKGKEGNGIHFRVDPKIKALTVECKGSYSNLRDAYAYALDQIKKENLEIVGNIREVYIHGCWDCKDENDYLTEIQIPVSR